LLLLLLLPLSVIGCGVSVSSYTPPADPSSSGATVAGGVRSDCGAILGTAFRSPEERDWYNGNCSHWPLTKFGDTAAPLGPVAAGCAAMAGKPYSSPDARGWFLQNCSGPNAQAAQANPNTPPPPPGAVPAAVNVPGAPAPNTPLPPPGAVPVDANVPPAEAQPPVQPVVAAPPAPVLLPAPDRHDCNAIRGTAYNSQSERNWYLTNCSAPAPSYTTASAAPTPAAPAPYAYPSGQLPAQAYSIQATTLCGLPIGAVDLSLQALHKQVCGN